MTATIRPTEGASSGTLTGNVQHAPTRLRGQFCPDTYAVRVIPLPTGGRYATVTLSGQKTATPTGRLDRSGKRAEGTWLAGDPALPTIGRFVLRQHHVYSIPDLVLAPDLPGTVRLPGVYLLPEQA